MSGKIGPGQYKYTSKIVEGPQYSMGAVNYNTKKETSISPGPGTYKADKLANKSYSYSMGIKTGLSTNKSTSNLPAPNHYKPQP